MANTFLARQGRRGRQVAGRAGPRRHRAADHGRGREGRLRRSCCPIDAVVAKEFKAGRRAATVAVDAVPADEMILDIGPKSVEAVNAWIDKAATLVWNGPLGAFEMPPFDAAPWRPPATSPSATRAGKLLSVAGGGDTVAALNHAGVGGRLHLRLDRRRRLPRMAGGQAAARRRGAAPASAERRLAGRRPF